MAGSIDSLDFCAEIHVAEKNAIPLDCWQEINLSDIWIPSHLLPNRNKSSSVKVLHGIYHTLERKDSSKYAASFSVYTFESIENGQGEIFVSDSDDDIFGSDSNSLENIPISDNTLPAVANNSPLSSVCSNDLKSSTERNILNTNQYEDKRHLNSKENSIDSRRHSPYKDEICQEENIKMIMNSNENLTNMRNKQQNESKVYGFSLSNSIHTGSQKHFAAIKENHGVVETCEDRLNKNTDSVLLKDILDDTSEINIKDSALDFKKKDDPFLLSLYDKKGKKVKKNKKDKAKKKTYIVLDNFLETTKASQDYYCDKYFQSILKDKQKDAHMGSDMEFPRLATNECMFTQSDKRRKEASCSNVHVESNMEFPYLASNECMFTQSDKSEKETSYSNVHMGCNMEFPYLASNERIFTQSNKSEKEASCSNVHMENNREFPYLARDEHMSTQSDKREDNIESTLSDLESGLIEAEEINENIDVKEINPYETDVIRGKIVIENIPHDTSKDDILAILCGYGEIKTFSLVSTGNFFTAYVEIDLICDIDWIIECLNGSEPFGASTEKIYCYKQ